MTPAERAELRGQAEMVRAHAGPSGFMLVEIAAVLDLLDTADRLHRDLARWFAERDALTRDEGA